MLPENLLYSAEHEWVDSQDPATVRVGITSVATEALGEVVFVDLPDVGDAVAAGEVCGEVESTKSVSDIYCPVTGTVAEINDNVDDDPALLNSDPYGAGWLMTVDVSEPVDEAGLMNSTEYARKNEVNE